MHLCFNLGNISIIIVSLISSKAESSEPLNDNNNSCELFLASYLGAVPPNIMRELSAKTQPWDLRGLASRPRILILYHWVTDVSKKWQSL